MQVNNITIDKRMLEQWLKSGFVDKELFYDTNEGTPQGGIISPTLMLMTLSVLEQRIKSTALRKGARANFYWICRRFRRHLRFKGSVGERYQTIEC
ncbi:hypothetical protein AFI02nite_42060 [Aliivibrio fischeri]|uniref:Reverse transcriptase domain-containing protein n=1 Tax=Aliivibrio fischeri TaxID=668 RepID=A0A510USH3_ALIFS|nr:hypothetical protein AFI02nite_42060 [Aliivibrio fischeri]